MDRRPIHQLSPSLVNRIAAGEVIERPASVVKELVENALDAGALRIVVEVEDGGRALVRVTDDGGGIPADELTLAFASHATSKIADDEDLFRISTMGFRGEALASIGSVSHAKVVSRPAGQALAYEVSDRGGEVGGAQAAAGNAGTVVEVRNLFFNTPARRKFLRGSAAEFGHISETVLRLALPFPTVAFKLLHNGRTALDLPATTPEERLLEAWPREFRDKRLHIRVQAAEILLAGVVGAPELARPTPRYQYLYLNGRPIRDKFMNHALREAYRGLTEPGRHPAAVLLLTAPPADVDVNVHPTKSEVRFKDGSRIHGIVHSAVREKLISSDLTPSAVPIRSDFDDAPRQDLRERLAAFFKQALPDAVAGASPAQSATTSATPWQLNPPRPIQGEFPLPVFGSHVGDSAPARTYPARTYSAWTTEPPQTGRSGPGASGSALVTPSSAALSAHSPAALDAPRMPAMQLHNSYLVAESDDGLVIIDQHALHERIMYEELLARVARGPLESQRLLIPMTIPASSRQLELLDQVRPMLARLGIEAEPFGPNAVAVQAFPSFLDRLDPADFVRELLERGEQELLDLHEEELLHGILDMMACKAAVKAGDPLSQGEIDALIARRHLVERSSNCPHGRPTTLRLTLKDLEKQFKRTGF